MAIVKEWKGLRVPDGSTYYWKGYFYNITGTSPTICQERGKTVSYSNCTVQEIIDNGVKLPEAETDIPDWDKAPSDTAVWIISTDGSLGDWHELSADGLQYNKIGSTSYWTIDDDDDEYYTVHHRPVEDKAEWDGKGLPPAGCECEIAIKTPSPEWHKAAINYISDDTCVYKRPAGECSRYTGSLLFRPLKTQEEKEREDFIESSYTALHGSGISCNVNGIKEIFGIQFDAGFTAPKGDKS